jgi:phage terminase small subunit
MMPILQNPRHERFAQELAKGKTADEAYAAAGYKPDRGHASRLAANGNIRDRVAELQAIGAKEAAVTIESLIAEAEEARVMAMENGQPASAVSAIIAQAKLSGLWVEKRENANKMDLNQLSDEQLLRFISAPPQETFEQFTERRNRELRDGGALAQRAQKGAH